MIYRANIGVAVVCVWGLACVICAGPALGIGWTPAQVFNGNAAVDDNIGDYEPAWAHDGQGNWVCVWHAAVAAAPNRDFDIYVSRSSDNGAVWSYPTKLDPHGSQPSELEDDFDPIVATDGAGHWIAVWYSYDTYGGTIGEDADIVVSRSTDNGVTWTSSVPLNSDAGTDAVSDFPAELIYDGAGKWVVLWTKYNYNTAIDYSDPDLCVSYSTDHGATWAPMAYVDPDMATDYDDDATPSMACDGNGHWIRVWDWEEYREGPPYDDDDLLYSTSTDGITWSTPATLNSDAALPDTNDNKMPEIETDGQGRWVVVWYYGLYETDYDIKYSYSDDNGANWTDVQYLNTNALTDTGRDLYPKPATDGMGNWVVIWESREPLFPGVGTDDDIFYAYSTDNGTTWHPPGLVNSYGANLGEINDDRDAEVYYAGNCLYYAVWVTQYDFGGTIGPEYDLAFASLLLPTAGDGDCDTDVDMHDFAAFQACYTETGPVGDGCDHFDFDDDDNVDYDDFLELVAVLSGPAN
jgi:hypothetical protein